MLLYGFFFLHYLFAFLTVGWGAAILLQFSVGMLDQIPPTFIYLGTLASLSLLPFAAQADFFQTFLYGKKQRDPTLFDLGEIGNTLLCLSLPFTLENSTANAVLIFLSVANMGMVFLGADDRTAMVRTGFLPFSASLYRLLKGPHFPERFIFVHCIAEIWTFHCTLIAFRWKDSPVRKNLCFVALFVVFFAIQLYHFKIQWWKSLPVLFWPLVLDGIRRMVVMAKNETVSIPSIL
jgi:hypothetical protein